MSDNPVSVDPIRDDTLNDNPVAGDGFQDNAVNIETANNLMSNNGAEPATHSETDPSTPFTFVDLLLFFGGAFLAAAVLPFAGDLTQQWWPSPDPSNMFVATMVISYLVIASWLIYVGPVRHGLGLTSLGFQNFSFGGIKRAGKYLGAAYLINAAYGFGLYSIYGIENVSDTLQDIPDIFGASKYGFYFALLVVGLLAPIVEEMVFRGFLYTVFKKYYGYLAAAILSAVVFSLFHLSPLALFPIFILGMLLAMLYHKEKSIYPSIFFHMFNNTFALLVVYYV